MTKPLAVFLAASLGLSCASMTAPEPRVYVLEIPRCACECGEAPVVGKELLYGDDVDWCDSPDVICFTANDVPIAVEDGD